MYIQTNALMRELGRYEDILIWGAGDGGKYIYTRICNVGMKEKVKNFVVSKKNSDMYIDDIPVIMADELGQVGNKCAILIAVFELRYIREIKAEIDKIGVHNVINLLDYSINIGDERRFLREETFSGMIDHMTDWYLYSHRMEELDYGQVRDYLSGFASHRNCIDRNKIVFIIGLAYVRTPKIAIALKKRGYDIKVLQIYNSNQYAGQNELVENQIDLDICNDVAELLYKALNEKPLVYYIDPPWMDSSLAMFMIYNKEKFGKIIFGENDIQKIAMLPEVSEHYCTTEQYALENADGVVWRYDAKDYLTQQYGYHYKGKSIQFYDYCNDYARHIEVAEDIRLKFCTLPTHLGELVNTPMIDKKYTHSADISELVNFIGNREDCLLDVYAWSYSEEDRLICKEIEEAYFNIKFYFKIPHSELIERMQGYDYGLALFKESCIPQYFDSCVSNFITEPTSVCGASNKYFDYVAAGLPVVTHLSKKQTAYMEQFGVVVKMDVDSFDMEYLKENKERYKRQVKEALPHLLIDYQIQRLIEFVENVANA